MKMQGQKGKCKDDIKSYYFQVTSTENITQAKIKQHCFDYERTLVAEMFFIDQEITSYNM